jgi:hypothetical protein
MYSVIAVLLGLGALNIVALISGASEDGAAGLGSIIGGLIVLALFGEKSRFYLPRISCAAWLLLPYGAWLILKGAYAGLMYIFCG